MIVDTDYEGIVGAIDVQNYQTAFIQAKPVDGNPDTAVIEVKRAFDAGFRTPSSSFAIAKTVTLDGSVILELDVVDTAFLHFDVTTVQAGRKVEIEVVLAGDMTGFVHKERIDASYAGTRAMFAAHGQYAASVLASPESAVATGIVDMRRALTETMTPVSFVPAATLTLDNDTITDIHLDPGAWVMANVSKVQSGLWVDLWVYQRSEVASDTQDPSRYFCILAEEGSNLSTGTSSGFQFSMGNGDVGDSFGCVVPFDAVIVSASLSVNANTSGTATVEVYKGAIGESSSSSTGVDVSLSSGVKHAYSDYSDSPVSVSAGDWITFRTTAVSGTVNGGRVSAWLRPI